MLPGKYYVGFLPKVESFRNPLPGFTRISSNPQLMSHLVLNRAFYKDLKENTLPQVCWLTPNIELSEHPPFNIQKGMCFDFSQTPLPPVIINKDTKLDFSGLNKVTP